MEVAWLILFLAQSCTLLQSESSENKEQRFEKLKQRLRQQHEQQKETLQELSDLISLNSEHLNHVPKYQEGMTDLSAPVQLESELRYLQRGFQAEKLKRSALETKIDAIDQSIDIDRGRLELLEAMVMSQKQNARATNDQLQNILNELVSLQSSVFNLYETGSCSSFKSNCTGPNCCLHQTLNSIHDIIQSMQGNLSSVSDMIERHVLKVCPVGYTSVQDGSHQERILCYKINRACVSWQQARNICREEGGDLLTLTDETFGYFRQIARIQMIDDICGSYGFWLGASDLDVDGLWEWISGLPVNPSFWGKGEPNGGRRENCAHIFSGHKFYLNDVDCHNLRTQTICAQ